jgi:hypothetical protein
MAGFEQPIPPAHDCVAGLWAMLDHLAVEHVPEINQVRDLAIDRPQHDFCRRTFLEGVAVVNYHDPIREGCSFFEIMGHQHDRNANASAKSG